MKRTFRGADALLRLAFLAALGFAIVSGGAYLYAQGVKIIISPLEIISPSLRFHVKIDWKTPLVIEKYTGPQNAQELMKTLDADYNKGHAKTEVSVSRKGNGIETESYSSNLTISEIDARYPRVRVASAAFGQRHHHRKLLRVCVQPVHTDMLWHFWKTIRICGSQAFLIFHRRMTGKPTKRLTSTSW